MSRSTTKFVGDPPKPTPQDGSHSELATAIERQFKQHGVHAADFTDWSPSLFFPRRLLRNAPYRSIYGTHAVSDFVYWAQELDFRIRIECRQQNSSGTVDEKFPYLLQNAMYRMPETSIWFVIDGAGTRAAAVRWLKANAVAVDDKTIGVYTLAEAKDAITALTATQQSAGSGPAR